MTGINVNTTGKAPIAFRLLAVVLGVLLYCNQLAFSQSNKDNIEVGFLIRDKGDLHLLQAAEMAIDYANKNGGFKGTPFSLATLSCEGPWGVGSKKSVELIYDHEVPLLVTALDGRNAHLAEQVTARSQVLMLSTLSSDQTLSGAYVPWFYRMVPDDRQQAKIILDDIHKGKPRNKVAVIAFDNYDGMMSAQAAVSRSKEMGFPTPVVFENPDDNEINKMVSDGSWDAFILAGTSSNASMILQKVKTSNVYSFLNVFNFNRFEDQSSKFKYVSPFAPNDQHWMSFKSDFESKYGSKPSPVLLFVYDGVLMSLNAIQNADTNIDGIRSEFRHLNYEGVTGPVRFDRLGNRTFDLSIQNW